LERGYRRPLAAARAGGAAHPGPLFPPFRGEFRHRSPIRCGSGLGADTRQRDRREVRRLLAAAQGGTGEADGAFSALWRDANPALLRYLRVIAPDAAEDIAADTWVQVVRGWAASAATKPPGGPGCSRPPGAGAIDEGRRRSRRPVVSLPSWPDDAGPRCGPGRPGPGEAQHRGAVALISSLPRFQAEVILLRVVAGLDNQAVAQLVGRSPGAVRVAATGVYGAWPRPA